MRNEPARTSEVQQIGTPVTAVVLNYKNYEDTVGCISALLQQDYRPLHCVIVDNASPNDSLAQLTTALGSETRVTILSAPSNAGYAAGNNFGARWALANTHPSYILILNPDVRLVDSSTISQLVRFADARPDAGAVSPKVILPNGFVQGPYQRPSLIANCIQFLIPPIWLVQRIRHQRKFQAASVATRCFRTIGACMLLRSDVFAQAGMFDEATFLENEEPILAERLRRLNKHFYHVPSTTVVHHHARPGNNAHTLESLRYYFKAYRGASDFALALLEFSSRFYYSVYSPIKRRLPITQ